MKKAIIHESQFVDLGDGDLKEALGYLWSKIKGLQEQKKNDPEILRMEEALKSYKKDNFDDEIKDSTRKLKAALTIAKLRGITWKAPEEK